MRTKMTTTSADDVSTQECSIVDIVNALQEQEKYCDCDEKEKYCSCCGKLKKHWQTEERCVYL